MVDHVFNNPSTEHEHIAMDDCHSGMTPPRTSTMTEPRKAEDHYDPGRTKKIYAPKSRELQSLLKKLWDSYCNTHGKEPSDTLRTFHIKDLYNFFHWMLRERGGRIRKARTLQTYWNTLTLVRQLETGCYSVDPAVQVEMCGARQNLAQEFKLSTAKEDKPIMRAEDEFELLKTLWESPDVELQHEYLRAQLALMIQLAGITGNRPGALRRLQYKDLKIALLPNCDGGDRPRLVIDFTFEHTKRYLGGKDANTFPVPDIPSESCLLLCPQTMLLGLLFADDAFAVPDLSPAELFQLRIPPGKRELRIPIKQSKAELPLFRRTERTVRGLRVSNDAVTENWLRERLRRLGTITNFEMPVKPYCFRRGHGEALDSSSHISDSQRNLILQHSSSAVFQHNYLSRYITQDTQAAYRGLEPQTAIIRAASGMSRSIDPCRPQSLNEQQVAQMRKHPEVVLARRIRDRLANQARACHTTINRSRGTREYTEYRHAQREYLHTKRVVHKLTLKQVQTRYQEEQPIDDILWQLRGDRRTTEQTTSAQTVSTLSSERRRVLGALLTFAPSKDTGDQERRVEAIDAVAALCKRQEVTQRKVCRKKAACSVASYEEDRTAAGAKKVVEPDPVRMQCLPTQCIFCIGNLQLPIAHRTKQFRDRSCLKRHLFRKHLQYHDTKERIRCPHPKCNDRWLEHVDHLRNHAARVHKTLT
ncbi:hypothetical protein CKM354_001124100 [Cercospora kikuchii]|uniref:C2H2-type domain-containing protein n=1 Tax=Cercospora kikuchii TaxID=84275 RepID=A0A9P3FHW8_9PEZI|nr:uncharacterized protein CKM354_001124100 [Cercospora kikuchii]GIZ48168.1 hypothetical protein CKM354_001124100 [Cercospora kikuchii]